MQTSGLPLPAEQPISPDRWRGVTSNTPSAERVGGGRGRRWAQTPSPALLCEASVTISKRKGLSLQPKQSIKLRPPFAAVVYLLSRVWILCGPLGGSSVLGISFYFRPVSLRASWGTVAGPRIARENAGCSVKFEFKYTTNLAKVYPCFLGYLCLKKEKLLFIWNSNLIRFTT